MDCLTEGRLRAYLDDELTTAERATCERHLAECAACAERLAEVRETSARAATALAPLVATTTPMAEPHAALARFQLRRERAGMETTGPLRRWLPAPAMRPRSAFAALVILTLFGLVLSLTPLQSLANAIARPFRVEQFAAVAVHVPAMKGLPKPEQLTPAEKSQLTTMLGNLGTLTSNGSAQSVRQVATLDEARAHYATDKARNGGVLKVLPASALPAGFAGQAPRYTVSDAITGQYALNVQVAKQYARLANQPDIANLPWPNVNQLVFGFDIPAGVAITYGDQTKGFGYVQMASPTLNVPNELDVNAFRAAVLALPGLPPDTVAQIKAIQNWDKTLIIPVPQDATTENVSINGRPGLLIVDGQGRGAVVLWEANGVLYALGGNLSRAEVLAAASNLR